MTTSFENYYDLQRHMLHIKWLVTILSVHMNWGNSGRSAKKQGEERQPSLKKLLLLKKEKMFRAKKQSEERQPSLKKLLLLKKGKMPGGCG